MTPPCLNCHGAPHTSRWDEPGEAWGECHPAEGSVPTRLDCLFPLGPPEIWEGDREDLTTWRRAMDGLRELNPPVAAGVEVRLPTIEHTEDLPTCPAEARWPAFLQETHPDLQRQVWWVRDNFERTREARAPFRIDVGHAELEVRFTPGWGATLPLARGWFEVYAGMASEIGSHQVIDDNTLSTIMNHLLDFQGVSVRGNFFPVVPWHPAIPLHQINIGEFGGLHTLITLPTPVVFFLQPFGFPVPPPGHDNPTPDQYDELYSHPGLVNHCMDPIFAVANAGSCPPMLMYPDRSREDSIFDLNLLAFLPPRLSCQLEPLLEDGRFPQYLDVEDLIALIPEMGARECPPAAEGGLTGRDLLQFLHHGELSLAVNDLNDLFIPGVLDLGTTRFNLTGELDGEGALRAELTDLYSEIEPMAYGPETAAGEVTREIRSGLITGLPDHPALSVEYLPDNGGIRVAANLHVYLDQSGLVPNIGSAVLEGDVRFDVTLVRTPEGYRPIPGTSTLELNHFEIRRDDVDSVHGETILNVFLSDDPARLPADAGILSTYRRDPQAYVNVSGTWDGREIALSGDLDLRTNEEGLYLVPNLAATIPEILRNLPLDGADLDFSYRDPEARRATRGVRGSLQVRNETPLEASPEETPHLRFELSAERLEERRPAGAHGRDEWVTIAHPLIPHATLDFHYGEEAGTLSAHIDTFSWPFSFGTLALREVEANLEVDRLIDSPEEWRIRVPTLHLSAQPEAHLRGITGSVHVEQLGGGEGLELVLNRETGMAEMSGLDLGLNFQALGVMDVLRRNIPPTLAPSLDPSYDGAGLDGHLQGDFRIHFTDDWSCTHGEGLVSLRGDTDGDIYFLDAHGRRVGAPLFRDTRWSVRRIDWVNTERRYALGDFSLSTLLNFGGIPGFNSERSFDGSEGRPLRVVRSPYGTVLNPDELAASMDYDNMPYLPGGFVNRISDYLLNLFFHPEGTWRRSSPRIPAMCREGEGGDR